MDKKQKSVIAVYAIIFVIYNILFWVIPFPKCASAIVMYIFTLVSIAASLYITHIAFSKGEDVKSKFYGFPVFKLGVIYTVLQLIMGFVICIINFFATVPAWVAVVLSVLIAGFVAVGVITADNARDIIEEQEAETERVIEKVTYFRLDIESVVPMCADVELKKKLTAIAEDFRYSDPVSSDKLKKIEEEIENKLDELKKVVNTDTNAASEIADQLKLMLADRNRLCKAFKK